MVKTQQSSLILQQWQASLVDHGILSLTPDLPSITGNVRGRAGLGSRALAAKCGSVVS